MGWSPNLSHYSAGRFSASKDSVFGIWTFPKLSEADGPGSSLLFKINGRAEKNSLLFNRSYYTNLRGMADLSIKLSLVLWLGTEHTP